MDLNAKIYVAGHRGLVGSALMRNLRIKNDLNYGTRIQTEFLTMSRALVSFEMPQFVLGVK